ncbi:MULTISPECIES: aromatase/cyclase [Streptomyces]|uniref:aromatase/cyclase n=1 Tax=Streptomyces TaxID=1883 RepID=UPI000B9EB499|nr:aromatase/cyclase [Streptomyces kasugaensis]
MTESAVQETEHEIITSAPPDAVYAALADAPAWPTIFPPTVYVDQVERAAAAERIRIWATANGTLRGWTSRRDFDEAGKRIRFRQEVSAHPVAAMGGEWIVESAGTGRTRVRLTHDFRAVEDTAATLDWIHRAVDRNSVAELAALRTAIERPNGSGPTSFEDTVHVKGKAGDVYDFLYRSRLWAERLDHVARITVEENEPGLQRMDMDTRTADGSVHTTASIRVCLPEGRIVYKQLRTPPLLSLHLGCWTVRESGEGVDVTSSHTVSIVRSAIAGILGDRATEQDARDFVRGALGRNSLLTLNAAKEYAEARSGGRS